jgi:hypothetical protein
MDCGTWEHTCQSRVDRMAVAFMAGSTISLVLVMHTRAIIFDHISGKVDAIYA